MVDESYDYFSNLEPVVYKPPHIIILCHHSLEIRQRGEEEVCISVRALCHQQFHENESPSQTSSCKIGGGAPNQVMSSCIREPTKPSPEKITQKENHTRGMVRSRRGKFGERWCQ